MDDPSPLAIGTTGTVLSIENVGTPLEQVHVAWDRGPNGERRTLMLVPADYRIVRRIEKGST